VLEVIVMDEDVISSDDPIGSVIVDLSVLLNRPDSQCQRVIDGAFPIYDINKGIRGTLFLEIKLTYIRNENLALSE
jgi:hypothetical protein